MPRTLSAPGAPGQAAGGGLCHAPRMQRRALIALPLACWLPAPRAAPAPAAPPPRRVALPAGAAHAEEFVIPVRHMIHENAARRLSARVLLDGRAAARAVLPIIGGD
jgi:hypothetical protein